MNKHWKRLLASVTALSLVMSTGSNLAFAAADGSTELDWQELTGDDVSLDTVQTGGEDKEKLDGLETYADTDTVRVIIELEEEPAVAALSDGDTVADSAEVAERREELLDSQSAVAEAISVEVLDGEALEVAQNLTLLANAMSASVEYGKVADIRAMDGVKAVYLEVEYEPLEASTDNIVAQEMTGAATVKQDVGYSGSGSRVAIIDTGTDTDHQSFAEGGYEHALLLESLAAGMRYDDYVASLNLLTAEEIAAVLPQLHVSGLYEDLTAEDLYLSSKLPFAFNYVDCNLDVTHDNDTEGEHGSHVAGIATANEYIASSDISVLDFDGDGDLDKDDAQALMDYVIQGAAVSNEDKADLNGDGAATSYDVYCLLVLVDEYDRTGSVYVSAAETVGVTGVASNAQLITMKVFGVNGGAYTSDYMAAIEDAVVLGCDVVNLSLGSANPGFVTEDFDGDTAEEGAFFASVMANLEKTDTVMATSAGNSGNYADSDYFFGLMGADEGGTTTAGSPGTYDNALTVASADNVGAVSTTTSNFTNGTDSVTLIIETMGGSIGDEWSALDTSTDGTGGTYEVVFLGDPTALMTGEGEIDSTIYGDEGDFDGLDLTGKVVLVARGNGVYFSAKHQNACDAGAAAVLIYNNVPGALNATIAGSTGTAPCGGLTLEDAQKIFALCGQNEDGAYTCDLTVLNKLYVEHGEEGESVAMSDFSSWGPTGSLTLKPEITAPGGSIYSVNGLEEGGTAYETMSGTSMASPHISGLVALAGQYIKAEDLLTTARAASGSDSLTQRTLVQSLLMSTATPLIEEESGVEYSVRNQGAGLANISNLLNADSFILMDASTDGKVKAELGDGTEGWSFGFTVNNLTDEERSYDLSASMLTTDVVVYTYYGITYTLSADQMTALGAEVTYTVDGESVSSVTVPAAGSAAVTVSIVIPEPVAAELADLGFTNGFYVEGFLYLTPQTAGEAGHSIPVLGWYGNWTDISMYDKGNAAEFAYDQVDFFHVYDDLVGYGTTFNNALTIAVEGAPYDFPYTGNIYGSSYYGDSRYLEARNALNNVDDLGWSLYALYPTLVRNAADSKLVVYDADTGDVYYEEEMGALIASFYYTNAGGWYDTSVFDWYYDTGVPINWDGTDAEGKPLAEGTNVSISLISAPEYYMSEDGSVDWDSLGSGAELSYRFTIDNTAPDLVKAELTDENTLTLTVQDNRYVAAVILANGTVTTAVDYVYPDMDEDQAGKETTIQIDLTGYREAYGSKAGIVLCDYAGNERYYAVNLNGEGASYGDFLAYQYDEEGYEGAWVAFDADVAQNETKLFVSDVEMICAEYVNGYIYAEGENGMLYGIPYEDVLSNSVDLERTKLAQLENSYQDLAYNYADGLLYGLVSYNDDYGVTTELYTIALEETEDDWGDVLPAYSETYVTGRQDGMGLTLAIDDEGTIYMLGAADDWESGGLTETAQLWQFVPSTTWYGTSYRGTLLGDTGISMDYLQSMTWNHNDETLYWARFDVDSLRPVCELYTVDPTPVEATDEDGNPILDDWDDPIYVINCTKVGDLTAETAGLMAPLTAEAAAKDEHANVPEFDTSIPAAPVLAAASVSVNVGGSLRLEYGMMPWYSDYTDVTWSSSDESVATVDANGVVTGVGAGQCTVTVASVADPSLTDSCTVNVAALSLEMEGIVTAQGEGIGNAYGVSKYTYSMNKGEVSLTSDGSLSAGEFGEFGFDLACSTVDGDGYIWASEYGNTGMIYKIDPETGVAVDVFEPIDGDMMFGLTYSDATGLFTGVMNGYLYLDLAMDEQMYEDMVNSYDEEEYEYTYHRWNLFSTLAASNTNFVTEEYNSGIVFCGITNLEGEGVQELMTMDSSWWYHYAVYQPTTTLVLLDNVGRLWYIDEVTGMTLGADEYGDPMYMKDDGSQIDPAMENLHAVAYTDEDGNTTYNVFLLREYVETALTDQFRNGELGITYHFSDIYATRDSETGEAMFFLSLYDYWNEGTTNDLYLLIPGHLTDELDTNTWEYIRTPDVLYSLGNTGENNIIATINSAKVTGGLHEESVEEKEPDAAPEYFTGYYKA